MIIDGRKLADDVMVSVREAVLAMPKPPLLTVITCEPNFETKKFLALKERQAAAAGILVEVVHLPASVTLSEVESAVMAACANSDGIIIQFPFPHLATKDLVPLVPATHDVDVMQYDGWLHDPLPPVVGAIDEIARQHDVDFKDQSVVVVGNGRLVGAPAASYAESRGANVTILNKDTVDIATPLAAADIIILGAGSPHLLQPDMVKDMVVVFDAGTSEEGGQLVGDADPAVAAKASLFTPVPRGIGPLTVAILLKNVLYLATVRRK